MLGEKKETHCMGDFVSFIKNAKVRKSQCHLQRPLIDRDNVIENLHSDGSSYCKGGSRRSIGTNTLDLQPHILTSVLESQSDMTVSNWSVLQSFGSFLLCFLFV